MALDAYIQGSVEHGPAFSSVIASPIDTRFFCIAVGTENEVRTAFVKGYCAFISATQWAEVAAVTPSN